MSGIVERGEFKITQVMVATGKSTAVYESMEQVPAATRRRMRAAFDSQESATMLIATREAKPFLPPSTQTLLIGSDAAQPPLDRRFWFELIGCGLAGLVFLLFAILR